MRFMKRVIKAVQSHRRTAGFVLAGLIFIVGGVFVLPKLINADGALVNSFGLNGVVTSNPSSALDAIAALAIDSNYLYTVGYQENIVDGWREGRIEKRRLDTGALCDAAAFGTGVGTGGAGGSHPPPAARGGLAPGGWDRGGGCFPPRPSGTTAPPTSSLTRPGAICMWADIMTPARIRGNGGLKKGT